MKLNELLAEIDSANYKQIEYAKLFIWYLTAAQNNEECVLANILDCFRQASLPVPNQTRLRNNLRASREVTVGSRRNSFRLTRKAILGYQAIFKHLLENSESPEEVIRRKLDVSSTPLLTPQQIKEGYKMGQVYVALHCLENSVRNLIRKVLVADLGPDWWVKAASSKMKQTAIDRISKEKKMRWLSTRGADELNYLDWGDLVSLIRKFPTQFERVIGDTKFAELKLEELENLRNVIAHNGILPDREITRVELTLSDWDKQLGHTTI